MERLFKAAENFSQPGLPGILHLSCSTGFGEDHFGDGDGGVGGDAGDVGDDDVDKIAWFAWHNHENARFSYSLLKHHGYIDWRTVGMRECYWCTLDITETVGLYFDTNCR